MKDSRSTVIDVTFNIDVDLQIANTVSTVDGQGPYGSLLLDYKGVRAVFILSVIHVQIRWAGF